MFYHFERKGLYSLINCKRRTCAVLSLAKEGLVLTYHFQKNSHCCLITCKSMTCAVLLLAEEQLVLSYHLQRNGMCCLIICKERACAVLSVHLQMKDLSYHLQRKDLYCFITHTRSISNVLLFVKDADCSHPHYQRTLQAFLIGSPFVMCFLALLGLRVIVLSPACQYRGLECRRSNMGLER